MCKDIALSMLDHVAFAKDSVFDVCLRCHDICAGAHFVPPMLLATSAIVSLTGLGFRTFGSNMHRFSRIHMVS